MRTAKIDKRLKAVCDKAGFPLAQAQANFDSWAARDGLPEATRLLEAKETELGLR